MVKLAKARLSLVVRPCQNCGNEQLQYGWRCRYCPVCNTQQRWLVGLPPPPPPPRECLDCGVSLIWKEGRWPGTNLIAAWGRPWAPQARYCDRCLAAQYLGELGEARLEVSEVQDELDAARSRIAFLESRVTRLQGAQHITGL